MWGEERGGERNTEQRQCHVDSDWIDGQLALILKRVRRHFSISSPSILSICNTVILKKNKKILWQLFIWCNISSILLTSFIQSINQSPLLCNKTLKKCFFIKYIHLYFKFSAFFYKPLIQLQAMFTCFFTKTSIIMLVFSLPSSPLDHSITKLSTFLLSSSSW